MTQFKKIGARREFQSRELWSMSRLRTKEFKERMGWSAPIMSGMEIGGLMHLILNYMLISEAGGKVRSCYRLMPAEGPYLLCDIFSELLHGNPAPEGKSIWELSRFAIETDGAQRFGFAGLALDSMREMVSFGDRRSSSV